ncbi:unnamed protein product [Anisakis simplex]|uniref:Transposase n=1 Tax=Anisakis simplex TaxID=6269 RepID=A0A0M3JBG2_ANISI|nr:unnamed protein product [Anisakis simplex]
MKRSQAKDGKVRFSHLEEDSASEVDASPDYHFAPSQEDSDRGDESDVATA